MAQGPSEVGREEARRNGDTSTDATASAPTSDEIRAQIEQTRAEMSQTIDSIQARLSPRRLMTDAKQTVKDATVGRVKRLAHKGRNGFTVPGGEWLATERILNVAKSNPVPVGLVGVAAVAVVMRTLMRARNHGDTTQDRTSAEQWKTRRVSSNGLGRNTTRLVVVSCAGLACWSAWRASRSARRLSEVRQRPVTDTSTRGIESVEPRI